MKNIIIVLLVMTIVILGDLFRDTRKQLASTEDDALQFIELAGRASTLTLAMTKYNLGIINKDSLSTVAGYYKIYLDSVTVQWEAKK